MVSVVLTDAEPVLHGGDVVLRDGSPVGDVRSASYGWTVGAAVGLASVRAEGAVSAAWLAAGRWEVDSAGRRHGAAVSLEPPL